MSKYKECIRCGKCCIVWDKEQQKWVDCKYLEHISKTKTRCKIYYRRLGTPLGAGFICVPRSNTPYDYPDCPLNTGKPLHPAYNKDTAYCFCWARRTD